MKPTSKYQCELALKKWKDDAFYAGEAIDMYHKGCPEFGYPKNLKKAIKMTKYWEKKKTSVNKRYFVYYRLEKLYAEIHDTKKSEYYSMKYYQMNHNEDPKNSYVLDICLSLTIKNSLGKRGKIVDKKLFAESLVYLKDAMQLIKERKAKRSDFYRSKDWILKIVSTDKYNCRSKPLELFFQYSYNTAQYYNSLTKEEIIEFLNLYPENEKPEFEGHNYLIALRDYKYTKKDDESKCRYAAYHMSRGSYLEFDPKKAFDIFTEAYENGYKNAYIYIMKYYTIFGSTKDKIDFLIKHVRKYNKDINVKFELADLCFKEGLGENIVKNEKLLLKAIEIYEKYIDNTNDEQKDKLSLVYQNGFGVEQDLEKAMKFAKSTTARQNIERKKVERFANITIINKKYEEEINKMIQDIYLDFDDINPLEELWWLVFYGTKVKKDPKYLFDLANLIYEKEKGKIGAYLIAACYFNELHVTMDEEKFKEYLNIALEENLPQAYNLLYIHLNKTNAEKEKVIAAIEKAIELGNSAAMSNKGYLLETGKYYEKDEKQAIELYQKAAELKNYSAVYNLATCYYNGTGVEKDLDKAYELFFEHANATNDRRSCFEVYKYNFVYKFKKLSETKAFAYLKTSAEQNYTYAYIYIADCYKNGNGTKENVKLAFEYYQKAADAGEYYGYYYLAFYYKYGSQEIKLQENPAKALEYFEIAYKGNITRSAFEIGKIYYYEKYKCVNFKKAYKYFTEAYKAGHKIAANYIGLIYKHGYGVKPDYEKAIKFLKEGYDTKQKYAMRDYSIIFILGIDGYLEPDYEKGIKISKEILKLYPTYAQAYVDLSYCYEHIKDYDNAFKYGELALKHDPENKNANYNMGLYYKKGYGVEENYTKAISYYEKAFNVGNYEAYLSIADIYNDKKNKMYDPKKAFEYSKKAFEKNIDEARGYMADYYIWETKEYKKAYDILKDSKRETAIELEVYGDLFYNGFYVGLDYDLAFRSYEKALSLYDKSTSLKFKVGRCYHFGHGVQQDKETAYDLLYLSAKDEYDPAIEFLKEFYKK